MLKRLTRHPRFLAAMAWLLGLYIALVHRTTRWTLVGDAALDAMRAQPGNIILSFWHERIALGPRPWLDIIRQIPPLQPKRPQVLVSRHRDGVFIARVVARFNLDTIHGSTSKGGSQALRMMLRILRGGGVVCITPDGPRGPRRVAAPGVGQLAAVSGALVLPYAGITTRHIRLRSWDRMVVPLPFSRGLMLLHPMFAVPPHASEAGRAAVEAALTESCEAVDAWAAARRAGGTGEAELAAVRAIARRAPPAFPPPADDARDAGPATLPDDAA
ncbi:lysophospholipid acyltransferase family protein [Pararoseomonas indoligenes]|uniref:Lysophospholipid acyltransferase family protein n=1 Tax=Roseomonas indoligenes TaxID=2820811 RepID=A0A940MQF0_9PROT|nr:lysophospholipid acyltransferase family protein [Pararoseomonas indoligenes]MBP0491584.1 lysophospholipid acyltransferase family protein [Pararoseomonas indoligenes]